MSRQDAAIAAATDAARSRFWGKVLLPDANGCMDWRDKPNGKGYGRISIGNVVVLAHRCSLIWLVGPSPTPDLQAAHGCNRPICVAPDHLRWATGRENVADQLVHGTRLRGAQLPQARLTPEVVQEICETYTREKPTVTALAVRFGISHGHASRILNGVDWGWLGVAPGGPGPGSQKTHCKQGHEFTPENTYIDVVKERPRRKCRKCRNAYVADLRARRGRTS
jgi:hypothetical protein